MHAVSKSRKCGVLMMLIVSMAALANDQTDIHKQPLPEPLTLEFALSLADDGHPSLQKVDAELRTASAHYTQTEAGDDINLDLQGRLQWVEPSRRAPEPGHEDHYLALELSKTLYDFGQQNAKTAVAKYAVDENQQRFLDRKQQHYIEIMRRFFDVLLADLKFFRYNEEMAVAYIQFDRMRERLRLKQATDVDVLQLETEYQKIRRLRFHSQNQQRLTRARLAAALNRPGELSDVLAKPELPILKTKLIEVEALQQLALENNAQLKSQHHRVSAAHEKLNLARATYAPMLTGRVGAYEYSRDLGSSDKWRVGMTLDVPIYTGDRKPAQLATAQAELYREQAALKEAEYAIEQAVLETWLHIDTLRLQREEMATLENYQELALDHSRALYELELKADIGKSMVMVSEAEYLARQTDYEMAIAWEKLFALVGGRENFMAMNIKSGQALEERNESP